MRRERSLRNYLTGRTQSLPPRKDTQTIVREIVALHDAHGGVTYHPHFGSIVGQRLWAVSPYPERGAEVEGRTVRPEDIAAFMAANADLLTDPRHSVGTWYNAEDDKTYLDVVITLPSKQAAVDEAKQAHQIAFYDLANAKVIWIDESEGKE